MKLVIHINNYKIMVEKRDQGPQTQIPNKDQKDTQTGHADCIGDCEQTRTCKPCVKIIMKIIMIIRRKSNNIY